MVKWQIIQMCLWGPHEARYRWWCGLCCYRSRWVLTLITPLYVRKNYTLTRLISVVLIFTKLDFRFLWLCYGVRYWCTLSQVVKKWTPRGTTRNVEHTWQKLNSQWCIEGLKWAPWSRHKNIWNVYHFTISF